ncbi:MAG: histidinol dehydrogenase, partial [Cytophagales bacterium]
NSVLPVLKEVKEKGDEALFHFTLMFDKIKIEKLQVLENEFDEAHKKVSKTLKESIQLAFDNISVFHQSQKSPVKKVETMKGVSCWRKSVAIDKVGLYVPGGTAPLFSTVLMLGTPAKIAGCREIILCTPPDSAGKINPAILYAAKLVGVTKVFKVGGAQAIAAMAYGTESIPKTYKIFGPGNQFVTAAKQLVTQEGVAIDMPAGPSEVLVWADEFCSPEFVAADLLSQAEHGADSQVILVVDSVELANEIQTQLKEQLNQLPRKSMAQQALLNSSTLVFAEKNTALEFVNTYAAEHLIIALKDAVKMADKITNAGSVFIGNYSPESVGDYASGTNHTLPTNGYAKAFSGVSLDSFVKKITFQELKPKGLLALGEAVMNMAEAEGLEAHKNAVQVRINKIKNKL